MKIITGFFSIFFMTGCQTLASANPVPAVLEEVDQETMATLKSALAEAVKRPSITLGAGDLTKTSIVSVLPKRSSVPLGAPQNQAGNFSLPIRFTLMMEGTSCYAVKDGSDEKIMLSGVKCRTAQKP